MLRFCMLTPPVQASPCPQDVFTFEHPNRAHCIDNTRSIRLVFECTPPAGTGAWLGCGVKEMLAGWRCFAPSHLGPCMNLPLTRSPLFCGLRCSPSFAGLLPNLLLVLTPWLAVCHGFAGYFDAQLYKDVHLSIHPPTHTPNMFSWFPIYFPLRTPFYVPQGERGPVGRCCWAAQGGGQRGQLVGNGGDMGAECDALACACNAAALAVSLFTLHALPMAAALRRCQAGAAHVAVRRQAQGAGCAAEHGVAGWLL